MPGASCACRYRFAVELLKPKPMSASWLALTPLTTFGARRVAVRQVLDLRRERRAEVELEAGELDARILRRLEHVDAALVLRAEVLNRDRPPLLPGRLRGRAACCRRLRRRSSPVPPSWRGVPAAPAVAVCCAAAGAVSASSAASASGDAKCACHDHVL